MDHLENGQTTPPTNKAKLEAVGSTVRRRRRPRVAFRQLDFRVDDGLGGHTGAIYRIRTFNGNKGTVRFTNCRFHNAQDGKAFTF